MAQKWYQKATVQSSMINAIPSILVAIISIVSILFTYNYQKESLEQDKISFDKKFKRDSLLSELNMEILRDQKRINILNQQILVKSFKNDSVFLKKHYEILISEYNISQSQIKRQDALSKQKLNKFLRDFILNENILIESTAKLTNDKVYEWFKSVDDKMEDISVDILLTNNDRILSLWSETRMNNYLFITILKDDVRSNQIFGKSDRNKLIMTGFNNTKYGLMDVYNILNGMDEGNRNLDLKTFNFK